MQFSCCQSSCKFSEIGNRNMFFDLLQHSHCKSYHVYFKIKCTPPTWRDKQMHLIIACYRGQHYYHVNAWTWVVSFFLWKCIFFFPSFALMFFFWFVNLVGFHIIPLSPLPLQRHLNIFHHYYSFWISFGDNYSIISCKMTFY